MESEQRNETGRRIITAKPTHGATVLASTQKGYSQPKYMPFPLVLNGISIKSIFSFDEQRKIHRIGFWEKRNLFSINA